MLIMFYYIFFLFTFMVESVKSIVGTMSNFCISPSIIGGVMVYVLASSVVERVSFQCSHSVVFVSSKQHVYCIHCHT